MKCLKCTYERKATDHAPEWQCPSCGVAYAKALQVQQNKNKLIASIPQEIELMEHDSEERLSLAASGQKMVIYSIILHFILGAVERGVALPILVYGTLSVCVAVYALFGVVKICSGLDKSQNKKIMFMVLSFFPLINFFTLVYLNMKATKFLREGGLTVGLLGAKS